VQSCQYVLLAAPQAPFSRERYEQQEQLLLTVGAVLRHVLTRAVDVPQQTVTDAVDALFDLLGWPAELGFLDPSSRPGPCLAALLIVLAACRC
jgi:hypothetical protein